MYVGKKDDLETQKSFASDFDRWWKTAKHQGSNGNQVIPGAPAMFSFVSAPLSDSDISQMQDMTGTIYVLTRFLYSDHNGRWITDRCIGYQDIFHDVIVAHPCMAHRDQRYKASR